MSGVSELQEFSATVFGLNVAYLALTPFRYHVAIQQHANHVLRNSLLHDVKEVPKQIVESTPFRALVYFCGQSANLFHIDAVVRYQNHGTLYEENAPGPITNANCDEIKPPEWPSLDGGSFKKFKLKIDETMTQTSAVFAFLFLILASFDGFYNFQWGLLSPRNVFYVTFSILLICSLVPIYWVLRGRTLRNAVIADINNNSGVLYGLSWVRSYQKEVQEGVEVPVPQQNPIVKKKAPNVRSL